MGKLELKDNVGVMKLNDISLLITGPINDGFKRIIESAMLCGFKQIVVSTWSDELEKDYHSNYNDIQFNYSKDPGSELVGYKENGQNKVMNIARQNQLFYEGLELCCADTVLRIRSDIELDFQKLLEMSEGPLKSFLIITLDVSSISTKRILGEKLDFHICDWLFLGAKEQLFSMLKNDFSEERLISKKESVQIGAREVFSKITAEQYFSLNLNRIKIYNVDRPDRLGVYSPVSPISFGFYVVNGKDVSLKSRKYGLRFYRPFRIYSNENYYFKLNLLKSSFDFVFYFIKGALNVRK